MARFINVEYSSEHAGITRFTRGFAVLAGFDRALTRIALQGMAVVGAPVRKLASRVAHGLVSWTAARKQRQADAKLWAMALTDARILADLSRAMDRDALRDTRTYL